MAEMRVAAAAERSPSVCVACGGNNAPFVDLQIMEFKVNSPAGVVDVAGHLYLCVGSPERPGCAVQIGRLTGQLVDLVELQEAQRQLKNKDDRIGDLEQALKGRSVKIGDLEQLGFFTVTASTAGLVEQ